MRTKVRPLPGSLSTRCDRPWSSIASLEICVRSLEAGKPAWCDERYSPLLTGQPPLRDRGLFLPATPMCFNHLTNPVSPRRINPEFVSRDSTVATEPDARLRRPVWSTERSEHHDKRRKRMRRRDLIRLSGFGFATVALLAACRKEGLTPTVPPGDTPGTTSSSGLTAPNSTPITTPAVSGTPTAAAATQGRDTVLTIYSGRSQSLIGPLLERIGQELSLDLRVRYGDTAELATAILEEGNRSPADLFFAQDAGALGALAKEGRLSELPAEILDRVLEPYRSRQGLWVGISGRVRTVVYNTERVRVEEIPDSILGFAGNERWRNRLGWAPTNGSFQAFVTALRRLRGDDTARQWLADIVALNTRTFPNNSSIVQATIAGEIEAGFVNHYYLMRERAQAGRQLPAENFFYRNGDPGGLVNVAGVGILNSARAPEAALQFVDYLLSEAAQQYFSEKTYEYPLLSGIPAHPDLPPLSELNPPPLDLSDLDDLRGTLALLQEVGLL